MQNVKYRAPNGMPIISHKHPLPAKSIIDEAEKKPAQRAWGRGLVKTENTPLNDQLLFGIFSDTNTH
jgi:hypothetical protein